MKARYFTLEEAQATLPQVKKLMEQVQSARREILRLRPDALPAIEQAALNGGNKLLGELAVHAMRLEEGVRGIMALGAVIKDIDAGLVDFVGLRNGVRSFSAGGTAKRRSATGMNSTPASPDGDRWMNISSSSLATYSHPVYRAGCEQAETLDFLARTRAAL